MFVRLGSFLAMMLIAVLALASCGTESEKVEPTVTRIPNPANAPVIAPTNASGGGQPAATVPSANPPMTLDLQLEDIKFDKAELTVPANTQITINLKNTGAATHNFNIDDLNVHSGDIAGGGTGSVTFNSGAAGEHEYHCNIPGHKEAGMVGKLTVTANAESGATGGAASPTAATGAASAAAATEPTGGPAGAGQTTFDIELKDITFDVKEMTVPANTDITINLKNTGAAVHNFNIDELNVHSGDMASGESKTVTFNSGAAGSYQYYCNIPGHKEAGMVGTLTVAGGAGTASGGATAASPAPSPASQPTTAPAAGASETTFDVELKDIAFSQTKIEVPANSDITINLKNTGAAVHNFNIDALNAHSGDVNAGASATVTFNSGAPGEYQFYCSIPGHKEAGMVGTLIVVATAGAAPATGAATPAEAAASPTAVTAAATPAAAAAAGAAPASQTTFDVQLKDILFDVTEITVPANTEITVNLVNAGAATHNFNIDELNVHSGDVAPGAKTTVTFNSGAPAEYQYYCSQPGHREAGMVGKLTVVAGSGGATVASPAASPAAASPVASAASSGQTTFEIDLKDISFSVKSINAPANTQITITIKNTGAAVHNFNIDELSVHSGDVQPGASTTVTFNTGAAGTYTYYCNIPGHREAGMVGQLTVQ